MITLNVDKMRNASNTVFARRLDALHVALLNDPQFKHILDHVTFTKFDNGIIIFKSSYIQALSHISKEFTDEYICDFILNNSKYSTNSMCSNTLYWNVASVNDNNSILDVIYIYLLLSGSINWKTSKPRMTTYENYIHISCGTETGFVNLTHVGKKKESDIPIFGFSISSNKEICIIANPEADRQSNKSKNTVLFIKDSIILVDTDNSEIHMINAEKYKNYSKEHPFIEIKEEYR